MFDQRQRFLVEESCEKIGIKMYFISQSMLTKNYKVSLLSE